MSTPVSPPTALQGFPPGRLVDLTLTLHPGLRGVGFETAKTIDRDGWNARTLHLYSHAGTHMDAPTHFLPANELAAGRPAGEQTIDQLPLEACFGPAWVIDASGVQPRATLHVAHLGAVASQFVPGESLLFRTGWSQFVDDPAIYRDGLPRIADDLAEWMVERRVKLVGVEPPSVADVNDLAEVTRIHHILLRGGVTIVEGLTNLSALRSPRVLFAALPLKIAGGDGCPCRAFAIEGMDDAPPRQPAAAEADAPSPPRAILMDSYAQRVGERVGVRGLEQSWHTGVPLTPALSPRSKSTPTSRVASGGEGVSGAPPLLSAGGRS